MTARPSDEPPRRALQRRGRLTRLRLTLVARSRRIWEKLAPKVASALSLLRLALSPRPPHGRRSRPSRRSAPSATDPGCAPAGAPDLPPPAPGEAAATAPLGAGWQPEDRLPGRALPAPFNRRVRLLVEIADDPDDVALARQLFTARGWTVRGVQAADRADFRPGDTGLVVEVRRRGARVNVCASARHSVTTLIREKKLPAWVRDATLLDPGPERETTTYHVYRKPPAGSGRVTRWLWSHWRAAGGADTQRTLVLPGPPSTANRRRAVAELRERDLGGPRFDPRTQGVRLALAPRGGSGDRRRMRQSAVFAALMAALLTSGFVLRGVGAPWGVLALLCPAALSWPTGNWISGNEPRPALFRLTVGVAVTGGGTWLGYIWAAGQPDSHRLSDQLLVQGAVLLGLLLAFGVWHAVSNSWFSRNISWLLPALVPPLALALPAAGRALHTLYLSDAFGIPADAVHVPYYWQYVVALKPLGLGLLVLLMLLGAVGWARYFYWLAGSGELVRFLWPLVMVLYLLTVAQLSLTELRQAAGETADAARAGQMPAAYFGITGRLVCVTPLDDEIPVYNGPLPTTYPVLTFGTSGEQLWLWDPHRVTLSDQDAALRVNADDVAVQLPPLLDDHPATASGCPAD